MPRTRLTDTAVKALRPPASGQVTHWDVTLPGFGLRIATGGSRAWIIQYRRGGRRGRVQRLTLGRYPLMSLADARTKAKEALAAVVQGDDPAAEKRAQREAPTFEEVAREYIEKHAKKVNRSWREKARMLEADVIPAWRSRNARDITARDVREVVDSIADRGAPIAANRTFALIRRVFNWAAAPDRALVPQHHNPCRGMERPAPERQRERVLGADELRRVWRALDGEDALNAALFRLLLLTGQRGGEVRTMRWEDVDLDAALWTIPAERAKNGRAHRVPLSPQAVAILRSLPRLADSPFVFPSARAATGCRESITKAVARLRKASGVDCWPHDLRRTVASSMTATGISRLTVSKLLNHVERGVTAVYDRHSYLPEIAAALNAWAAKLEQIVSGEPARAKVLAFRA